ncbi:chaoptin-like [Centruroides sculpturatus]|uniref:chaoptin-like n=1 Tax=Centruroides sculpturatus TaxID=218467 RepID=UPI000C6DDF9A|nr:chaoptin-like [Centruroides sculpturatus]XP_023230824.1 chaoptin-like [Centruroides sculpturatus]
MDLPKFTPIVFFILSVSYSDDIQHPLCNFNPLCTCAKAGPNPNLVNCHQVPLISLPQELYNKTLYILSLKYNGLRILDENRYFEKSLWRLEIQNNLLTNIPKKLFFGVGKTLRELYLSYNEIFQIPREALISLEKLEILDLSYNHISDIYNDDFFGIKQTLKILNLAGNSLTHINLDSFKDFEFLHTLDLSSNMIITVHDMAFQQGSNQLKNINLSNNQLIKIPFAAFANLKNLQILNLMDNRIHAIFDSLFQTKLSLDELNLKNNIIKSLLPLSFQNFNFINKTFLTGNPIEIINENAFKDTNIKELYIDNCEITTIHPNSFDGLDNSLQVLDLHLNNISIFPQSALKILNKLKNLNIAENRINLFPNNAFQNIRKNLQQLDVSGKYMVTLSFTELSSMYNMRRLSLNGIHGNILSKETFKILENSHPFEKLSLKRNGISSIENNAFRNLPGLRFLDLSFNSISNIQPMAFKDIGYSLETLFLHQAFSLSKLEPEPFKELSELYELDLSANNIVFIPTNTFAYMQKLKFLNLNHNLLTEITPDHFQYVNNPNLEILKISFNKIKNLKQHTFSNLRNLKYLELNDNNIQFIESFSFVNLHSITHINLEGNKIEELESESFQNLIEIKSLNFAYNEMENLNIDAFNQVGTMSTLKIDVSYNKINKLIKNDSNWQPFREIKVFDFTGNNISYIDSFYLDSMKSSLTELSLSSNNLFNITATTLANLYHLQNLKLDQNSINIIEEDALTGMENLLLLNISHNNIIDLQADIFQENTNLRILDVSYNILRGLPDDIFKRTKLEILSISHNKMIHFPHEALQAINKTLKYLDLSHNKIRLLHFDHMKYLENLVWLDLSKNHFRQIEETSLSWLPKLLVLNLSHNLFQQKFYQTLKTLPKSLHTLDLAGTNLSFIPDLNLPKLLNLNLSYNQISFLDSGKFSNLSTLHVLDLSYNNFSLPSHPNSTWQNLPFLKNLYLSGNPILNLTNDSFFGLNQLEELCIQDLPLQHIQIGVFKLLRSLQKLEMNTYSENELYDLGKIISNNQGLRHLKLHVQENDFEYKKKYNFPKSLKTITLQGEKLQSINDFFFESLEKRDLTIHIYNTNLTELSSRFFYNLGKIMKLKIDVKNNKLKKIEDVRNNHHFKYIHQVKLLSLLLSGNPWNCDCNLAWIRDWIREKNYNNIATNFKNSDYHIESLRQTECINKNNQSILEVLKTDMNCYLSFQSSSAVNIFLYNILLIIMFSFSIIV